MIKTRVIDLTTKNITMTDDVKVVFKECEKRHLNLPPHHISILNPGANILYKVEKLEARDSLEIGYTGFDNERVAILCDLSDVSLDKLIALANFIDLYFTIMFRLPGENDLPEISVVFTELPYVWKDNIPVAKNKKIAAILKWQSIMRYHINIKYTAIGDYNAIIGTNAYEYNDKKVLVDTNIARYFYESSPRAIVHTVNPISDILYSMRRYKLLDDCEAVWISPSIRSHLSPSYIEDCLDGKYVIKNEKDISFLRSCKMNELQVEAKVKENPLRVEGVPHSINLNPKHIAVFATSIHDFMTFEEEIISYVAQTFDTSSPLRLSLFINYSPEAADDQKLYDTTNNFMNFIEDTAPIIVPTFYVNDIDSAKLADVDKHLLKYIPNNIEIYRTKILDTLCSVS